MANGSMPRPVAMYNEASVPTALSTGVFLVHMGVVVIGIALVYQAPYTIFALKVRWFAVHAPFCIALDWIRCYR